MKYNIGDKFTNKEGCVFSIIRNEGKNCDVQFEDGGILYNIRRAFIQNTPKNPNYPYKLGVGYMGYGDYDSINSPKAYRTWSNILNRCYNKSTQIKQPTYVGIVICEEWKCFQNFAKWFEINFSENYVLDKDILIKGNKVYSPETCCFVPQEINNLFTKRESKRGDLPIGVQKLNNDKFKSQITINGIRKTIGTNYNTHIEAFHAYKIVKEDYIKEVANKWFGKISEKCYQAMINYKVEITD